MSSDNLVQTHTPTRLHSCCRSSSRFVTATKTAITFRADTLRDQAKSSCFVKTHVAISSRFLVGESIHDTTSCKGCPAPSTYILCLGSTVLAAGSQTGLVTTIGSWLMVVLVVASLRRLSELLDFFCRLALRASDHLQTSERTSLFARRVVDRVLCCLSLQLGEPPVPICHQPSSRCLGSHQQLLEARLCEGAPSVARLSLQLLLVV